MCGDVEKLIKQRKTTDEQPLFSATVEDTYDIISRGHIATGHGGRDRMLKHHNQKNATSQQKLLNSTSPTALWARRNENVQEPQVLV